MGRILHRGFGSPADLGRGRGIGVLRHVVHHDEPEQDDRHHHDPGERDDQPLALLLARDAPGLDQPRLAKHHLAQQPVEEIGLARFAGGLRLGIDLGNAGEQPVERRAFLDRKSVV